MSKDTILLHPKKGLNPKMICCYRCGNETNEILLLGISEYKHKCLSCSTFFIGKRKDKCPKCKAFSTSSEVIGEYEKVTSSLCDNCKKEIEEFQKIVEEGGVYWRCHGCGKNGVIVKNEFTDNLRKEKNILPPNVIGIEFDQCPVCRRGKNEDHN